MKILVRAWQTKAKEGYQEVRQKSERDELGSIAGEPKGLEGLFYFILIT